MDFNLGGLLAQRAYLSPKKECFLGENYRRDFQEADGRANRFAAYLKSQGMTKGRRVGILCKNNEHVAAAVFGGGKAGVISVLLNWRLQGPELEYILNDCGAELLLYDAEFAPLVERIKPKTPVKILLQAGDDFEAALAGQTDQAPEIDCGGDEPAAIIYTSGTTGRPKGAVLSHNNLCWGASAISHTVEWNYDHRFLLAAPLFHIGGLAPLVTNVYKGTTTYFMPDFEPTAVWRTIAAERITTMMSVPLMLMAMQAAAREMEVDASSLINITCGASPVPASLIKAYLDMGVKVQQVYGITEFSGAVTFWTNEMGLDKCSSQGKTVFHGELKIVNPENGETAPEGQVGEIWCRGPMVFLGYWNNPEAAAAALQDGWYRSGDLGRRDEQGFFYVVDRLKDMIISGGENIYPAELEAVLASHPAVAEAAVIGRKDDKWGEIPVACVVARPGTEPNAEDLISFCREKLAAYKCVKEVVFMDALPRNSVGKVLKTDLRRMEAG